MNAIDILNLSNNKKYIEISKSLFKSVRNVKTDSNIQIFDNHLNRVINNVKTKNKQNQIQTSPQNIQINQQVLGGNVPQTNRGLLVDINGTTFPIPQILILLHYYKDKDKLK